MSKKVIKAEVIIAPENGNNKYIWFIEHPHHSVMSNYRFPASGSARVSMRAYMQKRGLEIPKLPSISETVKPKPKPKPESEVKVETDLERTILKVLMATQELLKVVSKAKK